MRIKTNDTIAVVIDYQERLVPVMSDSDSLVARTKILLEGLNALGIPIIITEQYPKGIGKTISEIEELVSDCVHYEKISFSALDTFEVMDAIDKSGRRNVIICGIEAHVCVLQTVIDLIDKNYNPIWVSDCITSRFPLDKEMAEKRAIHEGAVMTTTEAILFELTRFAGTEEFKTISKLIK